jgi:tetrahydromethanopterin S-methyltransferase subunit F
MGLFASQRWAGIAAGIVLLAVMIVAALNG